MTTLLNAVVEAITPRLYNRMSEETIQYVARMAIKAAFQHARDNLSFEAAMAGEDAGGKQGHLRIELGMAHKGGSRWPSEEIAELSSRVAFRAMIDAMLSELPSEGGGDVRDR